RKRNAGSIRSLNTNKKCKIRWDPGCVGVGSLFLFNDSNRNGFRGVAMKKQEASTTVVLMEKAIAFCTDKTETWLDVAFANKTKPKYESTEQLVAKGLFPGAVALPEPSRASQSPAAFECSQALEGAPPLFSEVRRDSLCPHDG